MPTAHNGDVAIHYETAGEAPETVLFVGDVGFGPWQWGWQHRAVAGPYQSLVFEHRGVGASDDVSNEVSIPALAADADAVLADAGADRTHLVGAGMGGLVALHLARTSGRVRTLTLLGSGVDTATPLDVFASTDDADALRSTTEALLSPAFRADQPDVVDQLVTWRAEEDAPREVWEAHADAVAAYDPPPLYEVTTPTLVVHGTADDQWPIEGARAVADGLPRGTLHALDARHLVGVERSRIVNDHLVAHLDAHTDSTD